MSLQAIRDDEDAARSLGVRVAARKRLLFVLAGFGCGAAGVLIGANTLFIEPGSIFSVQWSAYMIFMVLVGGLGTFEGPILGAILLFCDPDDFHARRPVVPCRSRRDRGAFCARPAAGYMGHHRGTPWAAPLARRLQGCTRSEG